MDGLPGAGEWWFLSLPTLARIAGTQIKRAEDLRTHRIMVHFVAG
jgi:hypothetical protein